MPEIQSDEHKLQWNISPLVLNSVVILLMEVEFIGYLRVTMLRSMISRVTNNLEPSAWVIFRLHHL